MIEDGIEYPQLKSVWLRERMPSNNYLIGGLIGKGERWEDSLAKAVMDLHDGRNRQNSEGGAVSDTGKPPKVVFVTATSAVPYAIAMKESWKIAYPNEEVPKFFLIDVSSQRFGERRSETDKYKRELIYSQVEVEEIKLEETSTTRHVGEKFHALDNAAVFDEAYMSGATMQKAEELLEQAGFKDVNFMVGFWGHVKTDWGVPTEYRPIKRKGSDYWKADRPYRPLGFNINEKSKEIVGDMKTIGRLMGNEIQTHKLLPSPSS